MKLKPMITRTPTRVRLPYRAELLVAAVVLTAPTEVAAQRPVSGPDPGQPTEIACAPRVATSHGNPVLTVVGSQEGTAKSYLGPSDTLVISGGRDKGVDVGQEYFVRRLVSPGPSTTRIPSVLHTAGWVRIVATEREASLAEVVGICGSFQQGDFLETFQWPAPFEISDPGDPDYDSPGRIMFGLDGRSLLAENDYFVLSLGTEHEVVPGQRLTIFRPTLGGLRAVTALGEAIVVDVGTQSTTARVSELRDIVEIGDLVAPQR